MATLTMKPVSVSQYALHPPSQTPLTTNACEYVLITNSGKAESVYQLAQAPSLVTLSLCNASQAVPHSITHSHKITPTNALEIAQYTPIHTQTAITTTAWIVVLWRMSTLSMGLLYALTCARLGCIWRILLKSVTLGARLAMLSRLPGIAWHDVSAILKLSHIQTLKNVYTDAKMWVCMLIILPISVYPSAIVRE